MAHYNATVPSSWSREQTFDYLADFTNVSQWDPSMESAELLSGSAGEQGATYRLVMKQLGKEIELVYTAVEVQRPERTVLRCETDGATLTDTVTVAANGAVTYDALIELHGVRKLADPLADLGLTRASDKARDSLAERLAGPALAGS